MIFNTALAYENWTTKYRYDGETPLGTFQRVSRALAEIERTKYGSPSSVEEKWYDEFLRMLIKFEEVDSIPDGQEQYIYISEVTGKMFLAVGLKGTPGGRITANAGTQYGGATLLNCFINYGVKGARIEHTLSTPDGKYQIPVVIEGSDSRDDLINIMVSLLEQARTLSQEGGYGINFDFIRPRGSLIRGTGVRHPGVVAYMEMWDKVAEMIVRGDQDGYADTLKNYLDDETLSTEVEKAMPRKGAQMGVLSVWHPDIEEFVKAKQTKGRLTKFNVSVLVDDAFMEAVISDSLYALHFNGKTFKKVKARELYRLIMESTYNRAEPGILFEGNMNRINPISYLGPNNASNPCVAEGTLVATEQGLVPVENVTVGTRIQTSLGFGSVAKIEVHENAPVYRIEFSDGTHLRVTEGHIFHVMQGEDARKTWNNTVRLSDLKVGDYVRKAPYQYIPLERLDLTRTDGFLAGYFLGDGCRSEKGCLNLSANSSEDNTYLESALAKAGFTWYPDHSAEGDTMHYRVQSLVATAPFWERIGLTSDLYSHEKSFPQWWLNSNVEFLAGVLDGLLCSDGNVNLTSRYPAIRFKSTSLDLHRLMREICLLAGADYKLYEADKAGEVREIYGREVIRQHDVYEGHLTNGCIQAVYEFTGGLSHPEKGASLRTVLKTRQLTGTKWKVKVKSIKPDGHATVYDLYEPEADDWNTHGIVSRGCGEIPGNPFITTVCLLGSLNLPQYVRLDRTFDWEAFEHDVFVMARFLENVNDIGNVPLPQYQWALENVRQYGMGINGLGSAMFMLGLRYGSPEGMEFIEKMSFIKEDTTWKSSALLAQERGPAGAFDERFFETAYFQNHCKASDSTKDLMRKYGLRNLKTTTNPPLGNSSVICDMVSNGIEPVFSFGYDRTVIVDKWPEGLSLDNVKEVLSETQAGDATVWQGDFNGRTWYYEPHNRGLCFVDKVEDYGYAWLKKNYPEELGADYLCTAQDLNVQTHVDVQVAIQKYLNQATSKTANVPFDYPFEDFQNLYIDAWKKGLIGFTTYRSGTMEAVLSVASEVVETRKTLLESLIAAKATPEDAEITEEGVVIKDVRLPDEFLNGPTKAIRREGHKYYLHLSYLLNDTANPIALWIHSNHYSEGEYVTLNRAFRAIVKLLTDKGVDECLVTSQVEKIASDAYHEKLGKIISMALRHNISLPSIVKALSNIEGDYIATTLTAVRKFLMEAIQDGTIFEGATCASCGSKDLVFESGCDRCLGCGASNCS